MKRPLLYSLIATLLLIPTACNSSTDSEKVSGRVRDHEAYNLGEKHAAEIISLGDNESAVQEKLLEVHARKSNFKAKINAQSAVDYERGFVSYIKENSDSLSAILF